MKAKLRNAFNAEMNIAKQIDSRKTSQNVISIWKEPIFSGNASSLAILDSIKVGLMNLGLHIHLSEVRGR